MQTSPAFAGGSISVTDFLTQPPSGKPRQVVSFAVRCCQRRRPGFVFNSSGAYYFRTIRVRLSHRDRQYSQRGGRRLSSPRPPRLPEASDNVQFAVDRRARDRACRNAAIVSAIPLTAPRFGRKRLLLEEAQTLGPCQRRWSPMRTHQALLLGLSFNLHRLKHPCLFLMMSTELFCH